MARDKLVSIQRRGTAQDSAGQVVETWTETAKEWASIEPVSTREFFAASGERAEITHKIGMHYGVTALPRDQVVYGDRTFDIKGSMNVGERNLELRLMCSELIDG
jgi:SPP1 family predicted phage head-tail adaptor